MNPIDRKSTKEAFAQLCDTIAALRHPVTGCPWDLEQTHASLRKYMIEEAYEAAEVMEPVNAPKLLDELGDVLLQVVLNSQLAVEAGMFSITEVIQNLEAKMRRRHPHVFGDSEERSQRDMEGIKAKWDDIKKAEEQNTQPSKGVFAAIKPGVLTPASQTAVAIGKLAKKINFDWENAQAVLAQFKSEVAELEQELAFDPTEAQKRIYAEMGDVYFSLAQLCRHLDIDPEVCTMDGNRKFLNRFEQLEKLASVQQIDVRSADVSILEKLWAEAKAVEKQRS